MRGPPFKLNLEIMTRLSQDQAPADPQIRSVPDARPARAEPSECWQLLLIPIAICVCLFAYASLTF